MFHDCYRGVEMFNQAHDTVPGFKIIFCHLIRIDKLIENRNLIFVSPEELGC